jgi:catechol 2,3-dioxygenase-like lactoylglutathione lyase family enzyme
VLVTVAPDVQHDVAPRPAVNGPGRDERVDARADAVLREDPVRPRKLGHVVLGSADAESSERFFTSALGFKVSDVIPGVATFLRCSSDHHNVLVLRAPSAFLHHTAWQVDDVDEVGRGATQLIERDPERHVWGPGRHHVGSNFFWYVRDPAGNFCEYYSDVDRIIDDDAWTPGRFEGPKSLYSWGPPPPACFLEPEDVFTPSAVLSSVGRISGK